MIEDRALTKALNEYYCDQFITSPGDSTGERAEQCRGRTDFVCLHCGAICESCRVEFSCPGTDGMHVRN